VVGGPNCTPLTDLIDETTAAAELNQPPNGDLFRRYDLAADGLHFVFDTSATNVTPAGNPSGGIQTYVEDLTCTVFATTSSCQPNPVLIPPPISNLTFTQPKLLTQSGLLMAGPAFGQGPGGASTGGIFLTGTCVGGVPDMISCMRNSDG